MCTGFLGSLFAVWFRFHFCTVALLSVSFLFYLTNALLLVVLDSELLVISIINVSEAGQSHLKVRISCQSMDLAAELVQDLARYFQLEELESEADFPAELQAFEEVWWNILTTFLRMC